MTWCFEQNVNARNKDMRTPLHWAASVSVGCESPHVRIIQDITKPAGTMVHASCIVCVCVCMQVESSFRSHIFSIIHESIIFCLRIRAKIFSNFLFHLQCCEVSRPGLCTESYAHFMIMNIVPPSKRLDHSLGLLTSAEWNSIHSPRISCCWS